MFIEPKIFYEVLERCPDLFPEWKKEGSRYWNSETGYMVTEDGTVLHDAIYRGYKYKKDSDKELSDMEIAAHIHYALNNPPESRDQLFLFPEFSN